MQTNDERAADERNGYAAPIRRALIEFPLLLGVPRTACILWVGLCFWIYLLLPLRWWVDILCTVTLWGLVHAAMAIGTRREPQWPEMPKSLFEPQRFGA